MFCAQQANPGDPALNRTVQFCSTLDKMASHKNLFRTLDNGIAFGGGELLHLPSSYPNLGLTQFWPKSRLEPEFPVAGGEVLEGKVEFSPGLWARLVEAAQARGYVSPDQYVTDLIERELGPEKSAAPSDAEIARKMEELGYLDFGRDI
jgi:hypothetical protein